MVSLNRTLMRTVKPMLATRRAKRRPPRTASVVRNHRWEPLVLWTKLGRKLLRNILRVWVRTLVLADL